MYALLYQITSNAAKHTNTSGTLHHAPVGRVCDGVDVRGHLMSLLALVHVHYVLSVDGQVLVWVDHHTEETRVRLSKTEDDYCHASAVTINKTNTSAIKSFSAHADSCIHPNSHR